MVELPFNIHCQFSDVVQISELKPHPKNRNIHPPDQIERLAKILRYQGFRYPIKVSTTTGFVTSGHGRIEAAKANGWDSVPVSFQPYDDEAQEIADLTSDNAIASWAELDLKAIGEDILPLGPDFDIELLGIQNFVLDPSELNGQDPDAAPEPPAEAKTKPGDLYELGNHRLLCGDATNEFHYQRLMDGKKADIVWTDPPYNVAYEGKTKDALTIENDSMGDADFYKFLYDTYVNLLLHTKAGGAIYVAHADSEGANFRKAMKDAGWYLKQCLIWVKNSLVMGRQDYHWKHEPILYGWAPGSAHNWYSDRTQTTVLEFDRPSRSTDHPTMKPVELVQYMLGNSSQRGETVLDCFGGSGTTLIACEQSGKHARLLELDPRYCDVIVQRWETFTGRKAELRSSEALCPS